MLQYFIVVLMKAGDHITVRLFWMCALTFRFGVRTQCAFGKSSPYLFFRTHPFICSLPQSHSHSLSVSAQVRVCVCCFFFFILLTSFDFVILLFKALTMFFMNFASLVRAFDKHTPRNVYKVHNYYKHANSINSRVKIKSQEKKNKIKIMNKKRLITNIINIRCAHFGRVLFLPYFHNSIQSILRHWHTHIYIYVWKKRQHKFYGTQYRKARSESNRYNGNQTKTKEKIKFNDTNATEIENRVL